MSSPINQPYEEQDMDKLPPELEVEKELEEEEIDELEDELLDETELDAHPQG